MLAQMGYKKYDDDDAFYAVNHADYTGDTLDSHPAIRELQMASRAAILRAVKNPDNTVIKVAMAGPHKAEVRGYVTLARFLSGHTPKEFESILGFKQGALQAGCRVYTVESGRIIGDNIGPRYFTSWSAGISPRDLERIGEVSGRPVEYHRDYPVAANPIPQFVLFHPVAVLSSVVLKYDQAFDATTRA